MMLSAWAGLTVAGVALDQLLGEPRRAHPLVAFGHAARWLEKTINPDHARSSALGPRPAPAQIALPRVAGVLAWLLAVAVPTALAIELIAALPLALACAVHVVLLWFALGARSLAEHIAPIEHALAARDLPLARSLTSRIVTRDLSDADAPAIARAAIESALENGNDAIFAALFWFALAGGPGALAFRLANTLDAMWGYRTPRLLHFGWAAARLDDGLNLIPARLTALAYALCGHTRSALHSWLTQARLWDSPNAGPVMASGAGSLQVECGGSARYHGVDEARPVLGSGPAPTGADIGRALRLVRRAVLLWLAVQALIALACYLIV